jgi:hypothetical protein
LRSSATSAIAGKAITRVGKINAGSQFFIIKFS